MKIDRSDSIYQLRKNYVIAFQKLYLPEYQKDLDSLFKTIEQTQKKMLEYDRPTNCNPHDDTSYYNRYLQTIEETKAELQKHFSVDISSCSVSQFMTYRNNIELDYNNKHDNNIKGRISKKPDKRLSS